VLHTCFRELDKFSNSGNRRSGLNNRRFTGRRTVMYGMRVKEVLCRYPEVFSVEVSKTRVIEHQIRLKDLNPVAQMLTGTPVGLLRWCETWRNKVL